MTSPVTDDPVTSGRHGRLRPVVLAAIALPVALALAVAVLGVIAARDMDAPVAQTGPLPLPPVSAPDAASSTCMRLLAALPSELDASGDARLPRRTLAEPAPPGAAAWAAAPEPVVLRCGLPRPEELTPTSALLEINGVRWLTLAGAGADTFVAVDRPVFVVLTVPRSVGSGPVQTVSDTIRNALPG
ncbi:MAG: DUF3515 domain-containing protein [Pseudonocardia sp.]